MKANSKNFLKKEFPNLLSGKVSTSKMYESKDDKKYLDNLWFTFLYDDLKKYEYLIFAGALDYENKNFKILQVPSDSIINNIDKISMTEKGWINLYLSMNGYVDLRGKSQLSFSEFLLN